MAYEATSQLLFDFMLSRQMIHELVSASILIIYDLSRNILTERPGAAHVTNVIKYYTKRNMYRIVVAAYFYLSNVDSDLHLIFLFDKPYTWFTIPFIYIYRERY